MLMPQHRHHGISRNQKNMHWPIFPVFTSPPRFLRAWQRHFLVWRKTFVVSLVGSLGEPLLYLLGMGYGMGKLVGDINGNTYLVFVTAGILASSSMSSATFEVVYGGFTRMTRQNTFHAMLATPLRIVDIVAGEVLWAASKALLAGLAIFLVGYMLGAFPAKISTQATILLILPVIFLSGLMFAAMGMIVTAISPSYEYFLYYFTLVITPMLLFCGVFYPVNNLPEMLQKVVAILPLTHVIQLIRPLASGVPVETPLLHLSILAVYTGTAFLLAVTLVKRRILT